MSHTTTYERPGVDDEPGIEIEVEFTLSGGHGGSAPSLSDPGEPPEAPELEIVAATVIATGEIVELTDAEDTKVREQIYDNLGDYLDDGDDYDDYRDDIR